MKNASKGSWLFGLVVLGLFLSCLSGPKAPPETKAPQASAAAAASPPAPVSAQAKVGPIVPAQVSDTRHKPLPSSLLVLSLPLPALPAAAPEAAVLPPPAAPAAPAPVPSPAVPALPKVSPQPSPAPATPPAPAPLPAKPAPKPEAAKPATKPEAPKAEAPKAPETTKGSTLPPPGPASTIQAQAIPGERKPDIARNVTVDLGQRIELPFEGSGWTYLGEAEGREGILYESRRYEGPGLTFVLNTSKVGDFVLRFQREDLLRGTTNEELVAVHVNPKPLKAEPLPGVVPASSAATPAATPTTPAAAASAAAPQPATSSSPQAGPAAAPGPTAKPAVSASPSGVAAPPAAGGSVPASPSPTVTALPQAQASSAFALSLPDSPEGLLQAARKELLAGRVPGSLAALDRFLALYPEGMDEVYYLYGLSLEQNGDSKDIKRAYASYKKLVDTWPESQFWDQAKARMAFLERHYFTIR